MVEGFLSNSLKNIGERGLIVNSKANDFYYGKKFTPEEIDRNLELLCNPVYAHIGDFSSLSDIQKLKVTSVFLYYQADYRPEAIMTFKKEIDSYLTQQHQNVSMDHLHLLFNIIEFEERYRKKTDDQIKQLWTILASYDTLQKQLEEYLLFKYYSAVLKYMLKEYIVSKTYLMDIVIDFNDEIDGKNIKKTPFLEYLELKNSLLNIKVMEEEPEKDYKEILTHSECIFDQFKFDQERIAMKMGMKMCDLQMLNYEYTNACKTLTEIFNVLKRKIFFASGAGANAVLDNVEEYLAISTRLAYCYVILGNAEEGTRYVRKIEKMLKLLSEARLTPKEKDEKDILMTRYSFYLLIYKQIFKYGSVDKTEMLNIINLYKGKFKNQIFEEDDSVINIYCMNSLDTIAGKFVEKATAFIQLMKANRFVPGRYFALYFSIFNQISILTKNVATDTSIKKQCEYVEKIKDCGKSIIDFTGKYLDTSLNLKYIFSYPYFKEVLIKLFFSYIYSAYFSKNYFKAIEICDDFEAARKKIDLSSGSVARHYWWVIKLKGDVLVKKEEHALAVTTYLEVLKNIDQNSQARRAVVMFNIGICYLHLKDFALGKEYLLSSLKIFQGMDQISPNTYVDKVVIIRKLISSLNI